jgi:site-specific recombinase XerD
MNRTADSVQTFKEAYQHRLTKETIALYGSAVEDLLHVSKKTYDTITKRDIRNWLNQLDQKGYQPATIYTRLSGIKTFYRYCMDEGFLQHDPAESIPLPVIPESIPKYLEHDQLLALRELVKDKVEERAIVELLYATGIRISEMVAIQKAHIDWHERIITILNGKGKKERIVLFTRNAAEYVQAYLDERTDDLPYLFVNKRATGPIVKRTVQLRFEKYREQLGFHFSVHTLRHTFAAHLAQRGMPLECIQQLLGHQDPHQTQLYSRLYNHARKEMYDHYM